jgi:hypothetical protein
MALGMGLLYGPRGGVLSYERGTPVGIQNSSCRRAVRWQKRRRLIHSVWYECFPGYMQGLRASSLANKTLPCKTFTAGVHGYLAKKTFTPVGPP